MSYTVGRITVGIQDLQKNICNSLYVSTKIILDFLLLSRAGVDNALDRWLEAGVSDVQFTLR